MSTLVTFFSAEGTTKAVAEGFAKKIGADCFEIVPTELYTKADINYLNPLSRCNKEQVGKKDVPVKGKVEDFDKYDVIYIGFPIWYAAAPRVIYTFCKDYNWEGKKVYAFATSGGSGIGKTAEKLGEYIKGAAVLDAKLVHNADEVANW
ncbi:MULTISPECIES: flavodoxin [unclassified Butyrivibrio]|uniref:flavodoxin n=1 Tax=unclassified Butyrivibrio TaxID=2639466 RepID=UPI0003B59CA3|nr:MULTISPECIES: flavodoxin [unclassified Butyrivibrio]